jgi:hypothetical protein
MLNPFSLHASKVAQSQEEQALTQVRRRFLEVAEHARITACAVINDETIRNFLILNEGGGDTTSALGTLYQLADDLRLAANEDQLDPYGTGVPITEDKYDTWTKGIEQDTTRLLAQLSTIRSILEDTPVDVTHITFDNEDESVLRELQTRVRTWSQQASGLLSEQPQYHYNDEEFVVLSTITPQHGQRYADLDELLAQYQQARQPLHQTVLATIEALDRVDFVLSRSQEDYFEQALTDPLRAPWIPGLAPVVQQHALQLLRNDHQHLGVLLVHLITRFEESIPAYKTAHATYVDTYRTYRQEELEEDRYEE